MPGGNKLSAPIILGSRSSEIVLNSAQIIIIHPVVLCDYRLAQRTNIRPLNPIYIGANGRA